MAKFILKVILISCLFQIANAEEIKGLAKIIDGDTVHINSKKIRLEGIDAPEIKQQCKKDFLKISAYIGFNFTKDYSCGVVSKNKLIEKINNTEINCISTSKDRYKRYIATCYKEKINQLINDRLIAKKEKAFEKADAIRDELLKMGIEIKDTETGTDWNQKS